MMSRNDFEILAKHLKAMYPAEGTADEDSDYRDGYNAAINQVTGACSAVNSRFDADTFKDACGYRSTQPTLDKLDGLSKAVAQETLFVIAHLEGIDDAGLGRQS